MPDLFLKYGQYEQSGSLIGEQHVKQRQKNAGALELFSLTLHKILQQKSKVYNI